jgi:hypothetical protein
MVFDLRAVVIAASFILASIAVAAAETAPVQPAQATADAGTSGKAAEARPIRVVLPAPWEPATASSGIQTMVQK